MPIKNHKINLVQISEQNRVAIERFCKETDWNAYWKRVIKACEPEIDAYHHAQAKSRQTCTRFF